MEEEQMKKKNYFFSAVSQVKTVVQVKNVTWVQLREILLLVAARRAQYNNTTRGSSNFYLAVSTPR